MIYLLEGIDGAGKTTLGKAIQAKLGGKRKVFMRHSPKPQAKDKRDITGFYWKEMHRAASTREDVILDRWWPSHLIYESHFSNRQWLRREEMFAMEGIFLQQIVHVHCYAPLGVIQARIQSDKDINLKPQERKNQKDAAEVIMRKYRFLHDHLRRANCGRVVQADTKGNSAAHLADKVTYESKIGILPREKYEYLRGLRSAGWGSVSPQMLVIGGSGTQGIAPALLPPLPVPDEYHPFTAMRGKGEDHRIIRMLADAGVYPSDVYFHNAWHRKNKTVDLLSPEIVRCLQPMLVAVVGKRAEKWWNDYGHKCGSSVRGLIRFGEPKEYAQVDPKQYRRLVTALHGRLQAEGMRFTGRNKNWLEGFYHADHYQS